MRILMTTKTLDNQSENLLIDGMKHRLAEIDKMIEIGADPEYFSAEKGRIFNNLIAYGCYNWYNLDVTESEKRHYAVY